MIKAIYKLPAIKHVFFITSSLDQVLENYLGVKEVEKRNRQIEHILFSKDWICSQESWKFELITDKELLKAVSLHGGDFEYDYLSCHKSSCLELLTINILKSNESSNFKVLGSIKDEDIIEVFL